jgi:hypothetical protein
MSWFCHRGRITVALAFAWIVACDAGDIAAPVQPEGDEASVAVAGDATRGDAAIPADGGSGPSTSRAGGAGGCETFNSSFEAIQKIIFERRGCTADACHGQAKVGGLDLRASAAWENLVDARTQDRHGERRDQEHRRGRTARRVLAALQAREV